MAEVTSLTAARILELASQWGMVAGDQEAQAALLVEFERILGSNQAALNEFANITAPAIAAEQLANSNAVKDLNDNILPNLAQNLEQTRSDLENVTTVDIPNLVADVESTIVNVNDRPSVYVEDEEPTNPDENGRYLVVGDSWYAPDNTQKIWNGVEWTSLNVEIPDLAEVIAEYISPEHAFFKSPVANSVAVTNGAHISPT